MSRGSLTAFVLFAVTAVMTTTWVYFDTLERSFFEDRLAGSVRLSEAAGRLKGQVEVYRALVNIAADDRDFRDPFKIGRSDVIDDKLSLMKLTYGARSIDLINPIGQVVASSEHENIGRVHSSAIVNAAMNGRLGYASEIENTLRLVRFSRGITTDQLKPLGAVVITANIASLGFEWPVTPEPIMFFNSSNTSISAYRTNLLLLSKSEAGKDGSYPLKERDIVMGTQLYEFITTDEQVQEVQTLRQTVPQLQINAEIWLDTDDARSTALLLAGLVAAVFLTLGLVGAISIQQRRRLTLESQHSATLEQRVEERTTELRTAQSELVEASNLAALGRFSAGISHELNQPLAAILNFAENGKRLIQKSRSSEASENLSHISDQIRRITRIIGNLRAFARQEHAPTDRVDLVMVVGNAIDMMHKEMKDAGIVLTIKHPEEAVEVMAGKVRLEQVVLNLLTNALDAMLGVNIRRLAVTLETRGEEAVLIVQDTGGGIKEPKRVFEPFYTTKDLGSSKGLGMGLALSFGLVAHFGGQLQCRNYGDGAEFTMSLPLLKGDL